MVEGKKRTIFAVLNHEAGRGPARLRRLVWDQEIAGSNPAAPTTKAVHTVSGFFVRESESLLSRDQRTKKPNACAAGSGCCRTPPLSGILSPNEASDEKS